MTRRASFNDIQMTLLLRVLPGVALVVGGEHMGGQDCGCAWVLWGARSVLSSLRCGE